MKIERLTLTHLRAFSQVEFEFQPGINLLVGINGAGKSTVLDALRILFSYSLPQFTTSKAKPIPFEEKDITIGQGALTAELEFTAYDIPFGHLVHIPRDEYGKPRGKQNNLNHIAHHVGRRRRIQIRREQQESYNIATLNELSNEKNVNLKKLKSSAEQPLVVYFSTRRSIFNMSSAKKRPGGQADAYIEALDAHRELQVKIHAERWLAQEALAKEDNAHARRLEILGTAVSQFLDNCTNLRAVRDPEPTLLIDKGEKTLDIRMLSDGERGMVALVIDLASRLTIANPHLENPLTEGKAIVLIDELDLHLHPRWQRTIARQLTETFPNCQFIVTTHSPQIVGEVHPDKIILIENGKVMRPDQSLGMDSNWILRHLMGADERDIETKQKLHQIEDLIEAEQYDEATTQIVSLRHTIGEFPDLVALQTRIDMIMFLSNDEHDNNDT